MYAIRSYYAKQMSDDEIKAAVDAVIAEIGAATLKDIGKVMTVLRERHPGAMDFAKASAITKAALAG